MSNATYFVQGCPTCGRRLQIRVEYLGRNLVCQHCQGPLVAVDPASARAGYVDRSAALLRRGRVARSGRARLRHPPVPAVSSRNALAQPLQILSKKRGYVFAVHCGSRMTTPGTAIRRGQTHGHAVVVVGVDCRAVEFAGGDPQPVGRAPRPPRRVFAVRSARARMRSVSLWRMCADVADGASGRGQQGHGRQRLHGIADGVHVDLDARERRPVTVIRSRPRPTRQPICGRQSQKATSPWMLRRASPSTVTLPPVMAAAAKK